MRFGAVMIDAEKEVDDDMAGTGTNISSGSGRRQGAGGPQIDTTSSTNSSYKGKGKAKAKANSTHELIREFQRKFPPGQPHPGWVDEVGDWAEEQARRKREKEKKKEEEKQSRENVLFSLLLHSERTHQDAGTDMTDTGNYDNDDDNDDDMVSHGDFEVHDGNDGEGEDGFFVADDEDDDAMEY